MSGSVNDEVVQFLKDYIDTWYGAHPTGECTRPSSCMVCRARKLLDALLESRPA